MGSTDRIHILTISLARHLSGRDVSEVIAKAWENPDLPSSTKSRFENVGFNVDPTNVEATLKNLDDVLQQRKWGGVIVGWCTRGNVEFTELFEAIVSHCVVYIGDDKLQALGPRTRLMFNRGPDDLVNPALRNFPLEA